MKLTYKHTMLSCYAAYITSAVINNLAPLLFVTFNKQFGLSLEQLASIVTMNFGFQIIVDFLGAKFADRIGYRPFILAAQIFAFAGFVGLGIFPKIFPSAYAGIVTAALLYSVGSGLTEVVISPIIEALPGDAKASAMSLLHSFYCWGHVLTVVLSTLFLWKFGIENWSILCILWAVLPAVTFLSFTKVPINQLPGEDGGHISIGKLFKVKILWVFMILMICSGAAEQSMAQWASFFAETELGVSKQVADLLGPCTFAIAMGVARVAFSMIGDKVDIRISIIVSSGICIISYLLASFSPYSVLSLAGCTLCGVGVAILWPGVLSLSSKTYPAGGTAMFAILALFGDAGCFVGPETVARASSAVGTASVKTGLLFAIIFPLLIAAASFALFAYHKNSTKNNNL